MTSPVCSFQRKAPVDASSAYRLPSPQPKKTAPSATTGLERNTSKGSAIVWFLGRKPCRFFASKRRSPPVVNFQRSLPLCASTA